MNEIKKTMIQQAMQRYNRIYPCGTKRSLYECFTEAEGKLIFWFNTDDQTTHLITR
ncbi:MAG: hypothetical protein MUF22_00210 [Chitinispirillaceae bacterium]|nr:hypothetical protein [Chitinispirillaceae bacterium]